MLEHTGKTNLSQKQEVDLAREEQIESILSRLRDTFIENKNIVDYDSSDPFIGIYWKDLVSAIKKILI